MNIKTFCGGYDSNFCYVVYDSGSKECCIIDPSIPAQEVLIWIKQQNFKPLFVIIMHSHFDHIIDLDQYRKANIPIYAHTSIKLEVDKRLIDHEEFSFSIAKDGMNFKVLHTPGHLYDCICLLLNEKHLFTSDTLFVESCGRIDLQGAEPQKMPKTLQRLKQLPDDTIVYPGHDYGSTPTSTIGKQKQSNKFLKNS